jgi:protein phosphatase
VTLSLQVAALSHVGLLRSLNEDSGYGGPRLLAIADGMGGHAAGEVASSVAISSLKGLDTSAGTGTGTGTDLLAALHTAAATANDQLREMVETDPALDGMGTTLTALLFDDARVGVLHVGDSRCYLLRDGQLTQLTHDDTLVQTLVDEGRITADEASTHPQRNLITNALDGRPDVTFGLTLREAVAGDRYLLCSDGLTGPVGDLETLRDALSEPDPVLAGQRLVELALRGGGPDNVTVVLADLVEGDLAGADAPATPLLVGAAAEGTEPLPPPTLNPGAAGRAAEVLSAEVRANDAPDGRAVDPGTAEPVPTRHRVLPRVATWALAVVVLLAAAGFGSYAFLRTQWYVGVDAGRVTVFRGTHGSVAGVDLHWVAQRSDVAVVDLPDDKQLRVRDGIDAKDRADADRIVDQLGVEVAEAQANQPDPTTTPEPDPSLTPSPDLTPTPTASAPG